MEYLLSAAQMQRFDRNTMEEYQMLSCVLMERAALSVASSIEKEFGCDKKILVIAGSGNNGGDGIAVARLLLLDGYSVDTMLVTGSRVSEENLRQQEIYAKYGGHIQTDPVFSEYDIIVDALFGIGLGRPLAGKYEQIVRVVNLSGAYVYAVDIPSGVSSDSGAILGCAIKADRTVTFGYRKKGHVLFPGCAYCGIVEVADVGIYCDDTLAEEAYMFTENFADRKFLPERVPWGNKGTFGKLLVIAGSKEIAGAAYLACAAAFRAGCGMVKLITHQANRDVVLGSLPECMISVYSEEDSEDRIREMVSEGCRWADAVLIGPGLGMEHTAELLTEECLIHNNLPAVVDADALNIIAKHEADYIKAGESRKGSIILTPHMGEFARLFSCSVKELTEHKEDYVRELARKMHCVVVCKDARTFVACDDAKGLYCNLTGNHGMATAGSGDILSGIAAVFMMQEKHLFDAAVKAVWLHGHCGDLAAKRYGERSLKASDLLESLIILIKEADEECPKGK